MVALVHPTNLPETDSKPFRDRLQLIVRNEPHTGSSRAPNVQTGNTYAQGQLQLAPKVSPRSVAQVNLGAESTQLLLVAAAMAFAVFGFLVGIRLVQGSPDPSLLLLQSEQGPIATEGYSSGRIVIAEPGDSMWSIALDLGAHNNPQPVVQALMEANGGDSVVVGQQIIIPEQLVG